MTALYGKDYESIYGPAVREVVLDKTMPKLALRMWFFLITGMDAESWVPWRQTDIARMMGLGKSETSKTIGLLLSRGLIKRPTQQAYGWLIDPNYACKGTEHIRRRQDGLVVFENEVGR